VGELKFIELRKKSERELGKNLFDVREFHDNCLKHGAIPISNLEEVIDQYIFNKLKK
jgi:uncharacterized protein (DUF885 family)